MILACWCFRNLWLNSEAVSESKLAMAPFVSGFGLRGATSEYEVYWRAEDQGEVGEVLAGRFNLVPYDLRDGLNFARELPRTRDGPWRDQCT